MENVNKTFDIQIEKPIHMFAKDLSLYSLKLNSHKGIALVMLDDGSEDIDDSVEISNESLVQTKMLISDIKNVYVVKIEDDRCQLEELTGGKGSSLGILRNLAKSSSIPFTVPDGV